MTNMITGDAPIATTLLPSAARAAAGDVTTEILRGWAGVTFIIVTTAGTASPGVTPHVEGYDPASGTWIDLLTGAAITGAGTVQLTVAPEVAASANVAVARRCPERFRLRIAHPDTDSLTYSVGAWLHP